MTEQKKKKLPKFRPGDKIYKLFNHNKVVVVGNKEEFIIDVKRRRKKFDIKK